MSAPVDLEQERYTRAKKRVKELRDFYIHAVVFVIVNIGLFLINVATGDGEWWFYWALIGWGIGLAVHGASVYLEGGRLGRDWEERKIRELMDKDNR